MEPFGWRQWQLDCAAAREQAVIRALLRRLEPHPPANTIFATTIFATTIFARTTFAETTFAETTMIKEGAR
jgi:hypothetical protein